MLSTPSRHPRAHEGRLGWGHRKIGLTPGPFDAAAIAGDRECCLGLLVTDGLITAEVAAGRAQVAWLIGAGDLVRPGEMAEIPLTQGADWRALSDASLLVVDRAPNRPGQPDPRLADSLLACAARTSHWLLATSLVMSSPSINERLLLLFALYGERWGSMTRDGVRIQLPLTHELLGKLCGARRPTVTLALSSLAQEGFLTRVSHAVWLLHRNPELNGDAYPCWPRYASALGFAQPPLDASRPQVAST